MKPWLLLKRSVSFLARRIAPAAGVVLLASCGGGGSDGSVPPPPANQTGSIVLSINDAAGDFASYAVSVDQVKLTRDDGTVVLALPAPVTVDLAQLVDASQLFAGVSLPTGTYTSMDVTLDYSNADISAEDDTGQVVALSPVTDTGATAGTVTAGIRFTSTSAIVVKQGTPLLASLDFDLAASNAIDFTATPPTVTVTPLLYAVANPADLPYSRASGTLDSVDTGASTYKINLVPLFYTGNNDFGSLVVATGSQTAFRINGTAYTGQAGLQAMASLATDTFTLAYGNYSASNGQFIADEVYAGSSVPGVDSDMVHGSVIARSVNLLTVRGQTWNHTSGDTLYHTTVAVSVGPGTVVYKAGDPSAQVGTDDISVGQQVTILGTLTDTSPTSLAMDAGASSTGYVRLSLSRVSGTIVSMTSPDMVLNLSGINHHTVAWYDFSGTGVSAAVDADPANYDVNIGTMDLSGFNAGDPVEIDGFVQAFGQAPPDFNAESIGNYRTTGAMLMVGWRPHGTPTPFTTADATTLQIDLSDPNIGPIAALRRGGPPIRLSTLPASPAIVPPSSGTGLFAISQSGTVTLYVGFGAFVDALQSQLNANAAMTGFFARGGYDSQSNTFTATHISVHLK